SSCTTGRTAPRTRYCSSCAASATRSRAAVHPSRSWGSSEKRAPGRRSARGGGRRRGIRGGAPPLRHPRLRRRGAPPRAGAARGPRAGAVRRLSHRLRAALLPAAGLAARGGRLGCDPLGAGRRAGRGGRAALRARAPAGRPGACLGGGGARGRLLPARRAGARGAVQRAVPGVVRRPRRCGARGAAGRRGAGAALACGGRRGDRGGRRRDEAEQRAPPRRGGRGGGRPGRGARRQWRMGGAGVAGLYALPFPWPAGVAAAAGLAVFAVRSRGAGALALAALALAVGAGAAGAGAPLPALRLGAEQAAFALVPLALWSALAELRRGGDAAPLAPSALAATAALQLYPRADFVHLMPLGVLLLPLALRLWARLPLPPRALIALPLVVAAVRFAPTGLVLGRLASGRIAHVALGATDLVVDPAGAEPLRAIVRAAAAVRAVAPEESVLAFPACGIVLFVAERSPAGPHDYFFPGRPDRAEADALATRLAAAPPPLAVTCAAADTALAAAWNYYPALVALLTSRYREVVVAPPFTVRARERPLP